MTAVAAGPSWTWRGREWDRGSHGERANMVTHTLDTDYLVIGAGAAGMAFTDALIADYGADVVMVDRRHAPGGHWNDATPSSGCISRRRTTE